MNTQNTRQNGVASFTDPQNFSLVLGGPLFQLLYRAHLVDDAEGLVWRRIWVISGLCWIPLLLLSLPHHQATLASGALPFWQDADVHIRFLLVIPILIAAELLVHLRVRGVVQQFLLRDLIPDEAMAQFNVAIERALRLRNSVLAELIIILVVTLGFYFLWRDYMQLGVNTWFAVHTADGVAFTPAGWWYAVVSLPVLRFLLLRWYFRVFIWIRFLWQVSRIELRLLPTHTDRLGGLGFIAGTFYIFMPLAVAHGALLAGVLANRVLYDGAVLTHFKVEIGLMVVFVQLMVLAPLLVFTLQLSRAKRAANREYGALVMQHNRQFEQKWLRGETKQYPDDEAILGNPDVSSLVDLGSSYDVVRQMRIVPITKDAVLTLAAATLLPLVPLLLTMMPMEELLKRLLGMLF
ncbi:hypothetical protein HQ393_09165 [Chitinibacter bivalviorum]|uniref:Uncharacterized protein n=1 Tax=Chitinibacter bivalviorum TaxID=2739434 RepID=A0A7H9BI53_9NEIS|nr:hypothetical protein [Chitinibacter bivalviorum]QLG88403.1 hypothetical protein HQ393_09165 [Chitinibacter bivalviorum]